MRHLRVCEHCGRNETVQDTTEWRHVVGYHVTESDFVKYDRPACSVACAEAILSKITGEPALATD